MIVIIKNKAGELAFQYDTEETTLGAVLVKMINEGKAIEGLDLSDKNLSHTVFRGGKFVGVNFTDATMKSVEFIKCEIDECDFTFVNGAEMKFTNTPIKNSRFNTASMPGCRFNGAEILDCVFYSTHLKNIEVRDTKLVGSNFQSATLDSAKFCAAELSECVFRYSRLTDTKFYDSKFSGCDLSWVHLVSASFEDSAFSNSNLRTTNLYKTKFSSVKFENVSFSKVPQHSNQFSACAFKDVNIESEVVQKPPTVLFNTWSIGITEKYMRIGCQRYTHLQWEEFDDDYIASISRDALKFWKVWKKALLEMCRAHRAS